MSNPVYEIKGSGDILVVYEDRLTITPFGVIGFLGKGIKGTKTIPFTSITSIEMKEAGFLSGYLQFGTPDASSNRGGLIAASHDENTFMFNNTSGFNEKVRSIKSYVESRIRDIKNEKVDSASGKESLGDQIVKLAELHQRGLLSDEEFKSAKAKLIG